MRRIFTFLLIFFGLNMAHAQLSAEDIVFWVGEGEQEAYMLVDFRDGTEDASFGWGVRFNEEELTMTEALNLIDQADVGFTLSTIYNGMYLEGISYNNHEGFDLEPESWSIWSGNSEDTLGMGSGIGQTLSDGKWYGVSYGFNPPLAPTFKYAAYNPEWFTLDEVEYWVGEGENKAAVTIDFVADENEEVVTYVWGVKFEDALTASEALELLATADNDLEVVFDESGMLESITYKNMLREIDDENIWKAFIGNSMSDYQPTTFEEEITNNKLFGISFGDVNVRRPFVPTAVEDPFLNVADIVTPSTIKLWPNPASHTLHIESEIAIETVRIFNMLGVEVLQTTSNTINVSTLSSGAYLVEITDAINSKIQRFIKR